MQVHIEGLCFTGHFFLLEIVRSVFVSSIISSHIITESSVILTKCFYFCHYM